MTAAELRRLAATRWDALAPRERRLVAVAALCVAAALLWWVALQPALRTLREAPARIGALDLQLAEMQRLAAESRALAGTAAISDAQSRKALEAATARLGPGARLQVQGDRATLTATDIPGDALWNWMSEARSAARARPVEAQLARTPKGYSGTVVLNLAGAA
ncbi:type II secretion system protein GspM [Caldimonas tepidiphila]|uniref:type II secretion system protein GspM n=1 Tax=Caldimonas tepidiphila TaxID=2315841 RepID=UPI001F0C7A58|nr:type II secretion system protein GspM [Caldimonas tepidiphila]